MAVSLADAETYQTTYRRDFTERRLEMTGPAGQPVSMKSASVGPYPSKRPRRRARRATETGSQSGVFLLPGRSLTVGPAPGTNRAAQPPNARGAADDDDRQVSEALRIDMPDGDGSGYNQWLLSKLPEIVEKCCRQQEAPPRVIEVLPPPVRRKIRINVTSNANRPPESARSRADEPREPTDEFVFDAAGLRQVHRSRPRRRRRPAEGRGERRATSSSATSLESARRPPDGDTAAAGLVRRVLEEMFGPRPAVGGGGKPTVADTAVSSSSSRACQTSPRLAGGGSGGGTEAAAQTEPADGASPPDPGRSPSPSPRPPGTSRCILDTLTESNRLLRQMSEFFRRAELSDRITRRAELGDPIPQGAELRDQITGRIELADRITERTEAGRQEIGWRCWDAPAGGGGGGGTARSDGGLSRGDAQTRDALRQCSDSELSARIRRYAVAAEQGMTVRSWERLQRLGDSPPPLPRNAGDSAPSTGRSWASPEMLELHSVDRPYRPLASPPPRAPDGRSSAGEGEGGPRTSSPAEAACRPCSHRAAPDIDSTDVLLSYDPWQAIENDFKTLLK